MINAHATYQIPRSKTAYQAAFLFRDNANWSSSDGVCVALTQMVANGFLTVSVGGFQYTFTRTPLPPMTAEEKEYVRIFGTSSFSINGIHNPLLSEFNTALQNIAKKTPTSATLPTVSGSKRKELIKNICLVLAIISGLIWKSKLPPANSTYFIQALTQPQMLALIGAAFIFGLIFIIFTIKDGFFSKIEKGEKLIHQLKQEWNGVIYLKNTLQQNPTANLSGIPIKQLFPYVMATSNNWEELAHLAQHQPTLHPLLELCTNEFKQTIQQAIQ